MRLRPGAAMAVFALILCCLCEAATEARLNATKTKINTVETKVNITESKVNFTQSKVHSTKAKVKVIGAKVNATSDSMEMAQRALQTVVRWVRRVMLGGDLRYPGSDIGLEGSHEDYLHNEEQAFRANANRDFEDNRVTEFTALRSKDFRDIRDSGHATEVQNKGFVAEPSVSGFTTATKKRESATETKDTGITLDTRNREYTPKTRDIGNTTETRNRESIPETRGLANDTRNTGFDPETGDLGFASDTRNRGSVSQNRERELAPAGENIFASETKDNNTIQKKFSDAERFQLQPFINNFRDNVRRDSATNGSRQSTAGTGRRNLGAARPRSFDLSRGAAADLQPSQSMVSAGQRWLNILAEFLKTSREGRELLRAQAGQLLEGVDLAAGQLPRPVLLLPVPVLAQDSNLRPVATEDDFHNDLLELFKQARPSAPMMPPLLLPESPRPVPAAPLPPISSTPPPTRLRFDRSLLIRAELTVFYSDYTEPYAIWYDADSGSARVELHGGTTVLYRAVQPGGDVQRVQFTMERSGEDEVRRCTWLSTRAVLADRALPGVPDPAPFSFDGYQDTVDGRMERWTYSLAGQAGELGAARGEALVFRHELLVARVEPDFAIPYKYRLTVDSSVLGPEVDWYEHRYLEVREQRPDAAQLRIDVERACDSLQRAHRVDEVDPLREFVMTHRDSRCDADFEKFKETNQVNYEDPVDEAVRKTLLIRSTRFVESANRQGATAKMANSALGVMLPAELRLLRGTRPDDGTQAGAATEEGEAGEDAPGSEKGSGSEEGSGNEEGSGDEDGDGILGGPPKGFATLDPLPFPYSTQEVMSMAAQLQDAFSWKRQGGVTHIRNQGYCTSCWAFAVVCAIEGALFKRTGKLVPLSDQQLADCTRSKRSCGETGVVRNAYRQANAAGVVPLGDYPRYMYRNPKLEQCRKKEPVVTKISGFVQVPSNTPAIKVAIAKQGPVVVEVDSICGGFRYYQSGVLRDMRCNPNARNHAVTAIGYGKHKTIGDYFIIKNSWGLAGNNGFVHLHAESNTAGVLTSPSYPVLEDKDIPNKSSLDTLASRATSFSDEPNIYQTNGDAEYKAFLKEQKEFLDKNPQVQNRVRREF